MKLIAFKKGTCDAPTVKQAGDNAAFVSIFSHRVDFTKALFVRSRGRSFVGVKLGVGRSAGESTRRVGRVRLGGGVRGRPGRHLNPLPHLWNFLQYLRRM